MSRRVLRSGAAIVTAVLLLASCSIHQRARDAARAVETPLSRSVCVLFCDGLSAEVFQRLVGEGALPNIRREIVDRGLSFETAVASVPSETYPNLGAILTGLFPGHHGIPANIWLDRRLRLAESHTNIFRILSASDFLTPDARTLYERLPADTVAVTTPIARGAAVDAKNVIALMASYARWDWEFLDRKTLDDIGDAYMGTLDAGRLPPLVWAHLLGPDEVAHADGPGQPRVPRRRSRRSTARSDGSSGASHGAKVDDRILFVLRRRSRQLRLPHAGRDRGDRPPGALLPPGGIRLPRGGMHRRPRREGEARAPTTSATPRSLSAPTAAHDLASEQPPSRGRPHRVPDDPEEEAPPDRPAKPHPPMPNRYGFAAALARRKEIRLVVTTGRADG